MKERNKYKVVKRMNNTNGKEDRYWNVEEIRPYIIKYLKEKFPDSVIMREFDGVDIMIFGPNIPVEIQKTAYHITRNGKCTVSENDGIARFEDLIKRQIDTNIMKCEKCWLFMDDKYLNYLQNSLTSQSSVNLEWLFQYYKIGKVKVFSVTIDGDIRELEDKDFGFIKKSDDQITLERNKYQITCKILRGRGFTTEECISWYSEFEEDDTKNEGRQDYRRKHLPFSQWLVNKGNKRKDLGNIIKSLGRLNIINDMLKCNMNKNSAAPSVASVLRIIEGNGIYKYSRVIVSDVDNILEHFPGYIINKELWDYMRQHSIDHNTFLATVRGEYPSFLKDRKKQEDIEYSWLKY